VMAVVGSAVLIEVIEAAPRTLWHRHRAAAGISNLDFDAYFAGSPIAYGLRLTQVSPALTPIPLCELRLFGIEPPQSWRYLKPELAARLQYKLIS